MLIKENVNKETDTIKIDEYTNVVVKHLGMIACYNEKGEVFSDHDGLLVKITGEIKNTGQNQHSITIANQKQDIIIYYHALEASGNLTTKKAETLNENIKKQTTFKKNKEAFKEYLKKIISGGSILCPKPDVIVLGEYSDGGKSHYDEGDSSTLTSILESYSYNKVYEHSSTQNSTQHMTAYISSKVKGIKIRKEDDEWDDVIKGRGDHIVMKMSPFYVNPSRNKKATFNQGDLCKISFVHIPNAETKQCFSNVLDTLPEILIGDTNLSNKKIVQANNATLLSRADKETSKCTQGVITKVYDSLTNTKNIMHASHPEIKGSNSNMQCLFDKVLVVQQNNTENSENRQKAIEKRALESTNSNHEPPLKKHKKSN